MEDIGTLCVTRPFRIWVLIVQFLVIAVFSKSTRYYDILQLFSRVCVGPGTKHTYMKEIGMLFRIWVLIVQFLVIAVLSKST